MQGDMLKAAVERSGHIVGTIWDGSGPLPAALPEDAVLIHGDRIDGLAHVMASVRTLAPSAKKVLLCRGGYFGEAAALYGAGSDAILSEDDGFELVASTLAILAAGYRIVHERFEPKQGATLTTVPRPSGATASVDVLSPREQSLMGWILEGKTNKEIARELRIKDSTVKVHLRSIYQKIRVHNRTQAAIWARQYLPPSVPLLRTGSDLY
jgi:two-component system nitrate/nitrite response regulator NarL